MNENKTEFHKQAREAFLDFMSRQGLMAPSLEILATSTGMSYPELHETYVSIDRLEQDVWLGFLETTLHRLNSSPEYEEYLAREKALAFYYTFIEVLEPHRIYARTAWENASILRYLAPFLDTFRPAFDNYVNDLLKFARNTQEVPNRPLIDTIYPEVFWVQFIFVFNFWLNDKSPEASQTDAAVEKAINLSFDLIGHTPVDSLFDFGKFLLQKNEA